MSTFEGIQNLNEEAVEALKVREQLSSLENAKREINDKKGFIKDEDDLSFIEEKLKDLTEEQLKALTDEEVLAFFTNEEGDQVDITMPSIKAEEAQIEFKRDFLEFLHGSVELDKAIAKSEEELKELNAEILKENQAILEEYGSLNDYIKDSIEKKLAETTDEEEITKLNEILKAFEYMDFLKEILNNLKNNRPRPANVLKEYKLIDDHRERYIKYRTVSEEKLKLHIDLSRYARLEEKFLPEKYHQYPNLFIFTVMRHISYLQNPTTSKEGISIVTLSMKLQNLVAGNLEESEKEQLINLMTETLDLMI